MPEDNLLNTSRTKPFVKKGAMLGYARDLKERGLWPPRLHKRNDDGNNDKNPTATPFLIIPAHAGDNGARPLPNTQAFHSPSIWIEDSVGNTVTTPVAGTEYTIKCRLINIGAFASYGGLAEFYLGKPETFSALAGTSAMLPALGRTGFNVLPGNAVDVKCPVKWKPANATDLLQSILVQVYDPFSDMMTSRFDARGDRHVGRHDFTSDFYVRDWTFSSSIHDTGSEPSTDPVFYVRSDVWNRRSNSPGTFVNDQPPSQDPQAGTGPAGDNFMFARISRNIAHTSETVSAHFLFAEFGTGSPYIDCTSAPDPSITFMPGETEKIISQPWHLHPSSSQHLCIAVQIYSAADPYMPPGLLGYTPGWPTTDMMVINDNNKAQRNIKVWNGIPDEPGLHFAMIYNSATFVRDLELQVTASPETVRRFTNARVILHGGGYNMPLSEMGTIRIPAMLPGERQWISFSYDAFSKAEGQNLSVSFNEMHDGAIVNGFAFNIDAASDRQSLTACLEQHLAACERMENLGVKSGKRAAEYCKELIAAKPEAKKYMDVLPQLCQQLMECVREMSVAFEGFRDMFGVTENIRQLAGYTDVKLVSKAIAAHQLLLNQLDAWQTTALKSRGDEAAILFTVRLQKDVYCKEQATSDHSYGDLIKATKEFMSHYSSGKVGSREYPAFVKSMMRYFEESAKDANNAILKKRVADLGNSLDKPVAGIQKAHLAFLNDLMRTGKNKKSICD